MYTPTYILNQSEVIMMFDSGAGVEVVENRGFLTGRVYLPWTFIVSLPLKFTNLLQFTQIYRLKSVVKYPKTLTIFLYLFL